MARSVPSYFLLSALALALPAWAAAAKPAAATSCGASGSAAISSDIDYAAINTQLLQPDAMQRLVGLQAEIRKLDVARAPEAGLVRHRLLYALAQTQAGLGMNAAAMSSLKRLPVTSPQAPEALVLLAELEVASGNSRAAVRWLRKMADLYPEEDITVRALWRAAELNHPSSRQAIALWRQAAEHADQALASAQAWHARSQTPDFLDQVSSDKLSPELWRLARRTLTDPGFASADQVQTDVRRQLQCLSANQGADLRRMENHPRLLADLNETVGGLSRQLESARADLARREQEFLDVARRAQDCSANGAACKELKARHELLGRELGGWRNRVRGMESKLAFLRLEEDSLRRSAGAAGGRPEVASLLTQRLSNSRSYMETLLRESLASAVQDWEALSAEAHFRLADAQEPRLNPGMQPRN